MRTLMVGTLFLAVPGLAMATEVTWTGTIADLVQQKCVSCHGDQAAPEYHAFNADKEKWLAKGQGMRMDTYSHLIFYTAWPDTGALMRRLDDGTGSPGGKAGNMYQHLGATEAERQKSLGLFKSWVGNWVLKRWPDITKEEMNGITVKY